MQEYTCWVFTHSLTWTLQVLNRRVDGTIECAREDADTGKTHCIWLFMLWESLVDIHLQTPQVISWKRFQDIGTGGTVHTMGSIVATREDDLDKPIQGTPSSSHLSILANYFFKNRFSDMHTAIQLRRVYRERWKNCVQGLYSQLRITTLLCCSNQSSTYSYTFLTAWLSLDQQQHSMLKGWLNSLKIQLNRQMI